MADKQYDLSPAEIRAFHEKQAQRKILREYYLKQVHNPHRHATNEGGILFDPGMYRFQAMKSKQYDYFKATPRSGITALMIVVVPTLLFGWLVKTDRDAKEKAFSTGEVSYRDRKYKLI